MSESKGKFNEAIINVSIPILILDNKWHRLFGKMDPTPEISELEKNLTDLVKRQGKLVNENKDLKKIKSNLMSEIMDNMDGLENRENNKAVDKKLNDNKRLIDEVNEKLDNNEQELMEIPREIDSVNKQLMLATMDVCYERLAANTTEIQEIADWVRDIRVELKKNLIKKQDKELYNAEVYSYMHDIFGPIVMELFDMKYVPTIHKAPELKANINIKTDEYNRPTEENNQENDKQQENNKSI